jgi:hypothetical protein
VRTSQLILILPAILLAGATCWAQQSARPKVTIKVTDQSGALAQRAHIQIVTGDAEPEKTDTDEKGQVSVGLAVGCSAVFASAQGFKTSVAYIAPLQGSDTKIVHIVLRVGDAGVPFSYAHNLTVRRFHPYNIVAVTVTPEKLKDMTHTSAIVRNPLTNSDETYSGVTVGNLLRNIGTPLTGNGEGQPSGLIVSGLEYVELFRAEAGSDLLETALVADTMDGNPINEFFPFRFVVTRGKCPAIVVHNFDRLQVMPAK